MRGRQIKYSDEELAWIEENRAFTRRDLHRFFVMFFGRPDVTLDHIKALCSRRGWASGRTGRFDKGAIPQNKGKKMPFNANSARTQFQKGQVPPNTKWLGHERVSKDGYIEISVAQTNPYTGFGRRYVLKHRYLWEQANGPLAKDMCLKCIDGNRLNTDPSNWEAIPRAILPRLNGRYGRAYDDAAPELKPTIMAIARLKHGARDAARRSVRA